MLRLSALLTACLFALGLLVAPAEAADGPATTLTSPVTWGRCADRSLADAGLQCATLAVPLDHDAPTGATIRLALSRRAHTSSTYRGVMLVNPGGPGQSGLDLANLGGYVPGTVGDEYDWVGFDPRGVGASSPALRCSQSYFGTDRPSYVPRGTSSYTYWLHAAKAYADACANTATKRALLPHMTTVDSARDLESIRQALGVETIGLYGFSYGTYLGQVYATLFPDRVGRFVLDGVVDPTRTWYAANLDQDRAFNANLDVFWQYVAAHPRAYHLGTRWKRIKRGYYRTLRRLERHPSASRRLGPDELTDAMTDAGYYVFRWPDVAHAYSALVRQHRGGEMFGIYRDSMMGDDNDFATYNATVCTDAAWPSWSKVRADSWAVHRTAPFLTWSNTWFNGPCLFWHARAHARPVVSGRTVTAKVLLISETRDAATPYSGALRVRSLFPTASLVAGIGGTTHAASLNGVRCVDDTVATYLRYGTVPTRLSGSRADRACPGLKPPSPGSAWMRTPARSLG